MNPGKNRYFQQSGLKKPDYAKYTDRQLVEAYNSIDREKYSENYNELLKHLKLRNISEAMIESGYYPEATKGDIPDEDFLDLVISDEFPEGREGYVDKTGKYIANRIPWDVRRRNIYFSTISLIFGIMMLIKDDSVLRFSFLSHPLHLHALPGYMTFMSCLFAATGYASVIIDHYDQRNNEKSYRIFLRYTSIISIVLAILSFLL